MEVRILNATGRSWTIDISGVEAIHCLRKKIASKMNLSLLGDDLGRLKLAIEGKPLVDGICIRSISREDTILAAVAPRAPSQKLRAVMDSGFEDEDETLFRLKLAPNAPKWQRWFAGALRQKLHLPEPVVALLFWPTWKFWVGCIVWVALSRLAATYEIGPLFIVGTLFAVIYLNLGTRGDGLSAYSVFNPNVQRLPGQITAEDLDGQLRRGQM